MPFEASSSSSRRPCQQFALLTRDLQHRNVFDFAAMIRRYRCLLENEGSVCLQAQTTSTVLWSEGKKMTPVHPSDAFQGLRLVEMSASGVYVK